MPVFHYQGIQASDGQHTQGVLEADSERDARSRLKADGIYPTQLDTQTQKAKGFNKLGKISQQETVLFTRHMAALLAAGFPLIKALEAIEGQITSSAFQAIVVNLRSSVNQGQSLSEAMGAYPKIFAPFYINLVEVGENSGTLEVVMERLADVSEQKQRLNNKLISAMIYPAIMASVGLLVLLFLMTTVVPKVVGIFADSQQALPWVTTSLITISNFVQNYGVHLLGLILLILLLIRFGVNTHKGRSYYEHLLLKAPLIGPLTQRILAQRFTQTLGLLIGSGVELTRALRLTAGISHISSVQNAIQQTAQQVEQGQALAQAIAQTGLLPSLALRMLEAGEQSGRLEDMLNRTAKLYEEELQQLTERLMHLIEPAIIIIMGSVVAYVVVAVLLPLFEMNRFIS